MKIETIFLRVCGGIVVLFVLFWVGYMIVADYSYGAVSGTYTFYTTSENLLSF